MDFAQIIINPAYLSVKAKWLFRELWLGWLLDNFFQFGYAVFKKNLSMSEGLVNLSASLLWF